MLLISFFLSIFILTVCILGIFMVLKEFDNIHKKDWFHLITCIIATIATLILFIIEMIENGIV